MKFDEKIIEDFNDAIWRADHYANESMKLNYNGKFFGKKKEKQVLGKITEAGLDWAFNDYGSKTHVFFRYNDYDEETGTLMPEDCESVERTWDTENLRFADSLEDLQLILELED